MPSTAEIKKPTLTFLFLLCSTFLAASLFYFGLISIYGIAPGLFAVFLLAQGHYLMAYLWSVPRYRSMPGGARAYVLGLWIVSMGIFIATGYVFQLVPFHYIVFFAVTIGIWHNFRDYEFFYRQISSRFTDRHRTHLLSTFLSCLYYVLFFGILSLNPDASRMVFGGFLPEWLFRGIFLLAIGIALIAIPKLLYKHSPDNRESIPYHTPRTLQGVALVTGLLVTLALVWILRAINPAHLFYLFAAWHFIIWIGFFILKTYKKPALADTRPTVSLLSMLNINVLLQRWQKNTAFFFLYTTALYGLLYSLFLLHQWAQTSFPLDWRYVATTSLLWGSPGFVLFSVGHIIFSSLPTTAPQWLLRRQ